MAIQVAAPLEYALLSQSNTLIQDFAEKGLKEMVVNQLLEHKLVTKNFKAGLSFDTSQDLRHGFRKLTRLVKNQIIKKLTWLDAEISPTTWLQEGTAHSGNVSIVLANGISLPRYIRFMNRQILNANIPIRLNIRPQSQNPQGAGTLIIDVNTANVNPSRGPTSREMYRLFMYLPETVKFLETISRKAHFRNEAHTLANRFIRAPRNTNQVG